VGHRCKVSLRAAVIRRLVAFVLALVLMTLLPAGAAHAALRLEVPEEAPGGPFYARVHRLTIAPHTDE
jgi:hypothetical protein